MLKTGWLSPDPTLPDHINGVYVDRAGTKTRVEEYSFVRDVLSSVPPGRALDAATGYVSNWHVLPYILAAMGWEVETVDIEPATLHMPANSRVHRTIGTITSMPQYPDASFDAVTCISTIEHLSADSRKAAVAEFDRVLKPNGWLILTADNYADITPDYLISLLPNSEAYLVEDDTITVYQGGSFANNKRVAIFAAPKRVVTPLAL
jgi:2-polyprenyl-3-methyl-5-hydroxy-6-metoxy-1,4-benzoquinol methylase